MDLSPRLLGAQRATGCLDTLEFIIGNYSTTLEHSKRTLTLWSTPWTIFSLRLRLSNENESIFREVGHLL